GFSGRRRACVLKKGRASGRPFASHPLSPWDEGRRRARGDNEERSMERYQMLIGNGWVDSVSGTTRTITDPASGEAVASVPEGGAGDSERAIAAAREAFDAGPWRRATALERGKLLFKLAGAIEGSAQRLAELEVKNCGKPLAEAQYD